MSAAVVHDLADRLQRLGPSRRDPERYHVEKDALVHQLRAIADAWPADRAQRRRVTEIATGERTIVQKGRRPRTVQVVMTGRRKAA